MDCLYRYGNGIRITRRDRDIQCLCNGDTRIPDYRSESTQPKHLRAKFLGGMSSLNNLTINCPFWQLQHSPGRIRTGNKPAFYLFSSRL